MGLADWHIYTHTDGRRTALKQTEVRLFLVSERTWRAYDDVHGTRLIVEGTAATFEEAMMLADALR